MSPDHYIRALEDRNRALHTENQALRAALQRVRDLKMPVSPDSSYNSGYHAALEAVRGATDGEQ